MRLITKNIILESQKEKEDRVGKRLEDIMVEASKLERMK